MCGREGGWSAVPLGRTWQIVAGSSAIGLAVAAGAVAVAGPWESGQRTAERSHSSAPNRHHGGPGPAAPAKPGQPVRAAAPVLVPARAAGPEPSALAGRLDPLMAAAGMGPVRTGAVIDVTTGRLLYGHRPAAATTPASTTKIATAVAALGALGPDHRLTTSVVATAANRIVLVGGGDPTLELERLAADTAAALRARGTNAVGLGYDTSYFTGPTRHPIGYNDNLAPVTALMVRAGRLDRSTSGPAPRAHDPASAAAEAFATLLEKHGTTVEGSPAEERGAGGTPLATHWSEPLSALVEGMLTSSDNDMAEALARHVARATGRAAAFAGVAAAIPEALRAYGVPVDGAVFADGSGLDHSDRLAPLTLVRLLVLAASPAHPELRPVLTGLPVAAFTGTLSARFHATPGAGLVHAKTGTLTGTSTIAGTTVTPSGHLLAFAFMTQDARDQAAARSALDAAVASLAGGTSQR
jgi:D-alanyl-D-alanine carboxypeptidase/D-alanyl-D-alanine-endopeptidase (penicillin-binding protein 4)